MKNVQVEEIFYLFLVASVAGSGTVGGSHRRLPCSQHAEGSLHPCAWEAAPRAASGVPGVVLASSHQGGWSPGSHSDIQLPQDSISIMSP